VDDDDYIEILLRPPTLAAERCVILAALIRRLWIESSVADSNGEDWRAEVFDLREWLRAEGIWTGLTVDEAGFLQQSPGGVTEDELAVVAWQAEGLATLGWALGLTDLLPPGNLADIASVVQATPAPWDSTVEWMRGARFRPEVEIASERDRAEVFEWRVRAETSRRVANGQERIDYLAAIGDVVQEARASGLLDSSADDFVIGDKAIAAFDDQDLERLGALAEERLRALNWLCGYGTSWDDVPLDI
jgi:hypothetical protein